MGPFPRHLAVVLLFLGRLATPGAMAASVPDHSAPKFPVKELHNLEEAKQEQAKWDQKAAQCRHEREAAYYKNAVWRAGNKMTGSGASQVAQEDNGDSSLSKLRQDLDQSCREQCHPKGGSCLSGTLNDVMEVCKKVDSPAATDQMGCQQILGLDSLPKGFGSGTCDCETLCKEGAPPMIAAPRLVERLKACASGVGDFFAGLGGTAKIFESISHCMTDTGLPMDTPECNEYFNKRFSVDPDQHLKDAIDKVNRTENEYLSCMLELAFLPHLQEKSADRSAYVACERMMAPYWDQILQDTADKNTEGLCSQLTSLIGPSAVKALFKGGAEIFVLTRDLKLPKLPQVAVSMGGGAAARPMNMDAAKSAVKSAWSMTKAEMEYDGIENAVENRKRILNIYDKYLKAQNGGGGLRVVDAPQLETLENEGVPRYVIDHTTVDHHNSFGVMLPPGKANSTTQILDDLDPKNPSYMSQEKFNDAFSHFASDNIGDAYGLAMAVVRNANRIRGNPQLIAKLKDLALKEDFGMFGPDMDFAADDQLAALLRLNDKLLPKAEKTFMDRVKLGFGSQTQQAIEQAQHGYDRVLFPQNQDDLAFTRAQADMFRDGLKSGVRVAERDRIPIVTPAGKSAPIYFVDSTEAAKKAGGQFETWALSPQAIRAAEKAQPGAPRLERLFNITGENPPRNIIFSNIPGRGAPSMLEPMPGQVKSFVEAYKDAEAAAIKRRLVDGSLTADQQKAASEFLKRVEDSNWKPQNRPDGSLIFGPTYMTPAEVQAFTQNGLQLLGY